MKPYFVYITNKLGGSVLQGGSAVGMTEGTTIPHFSSIFYPPSHPPAGEAGKTTPTYSGMDECVRYIPILFGMLRRIPPSFIAS